MRAYRGFIVVMSWAVLSLLPAAVAAQPVRPSVPVAVGQKVRITVTDGRTVEGKVSSWTPESIDLAGTSITASEVQRVELYDSLGDGAGKGALILGLLGAFVGIAGDSVSDSFGGSTSNGSGFLAGVGIGLAAGAAIGAGLDARQQKTIYERRETKMVVAVRPIVSAAGKGVGVSVRW